MIIFLDFDGVTHPINQGGFNSSCLAKITQAVHSGDHWVVISSSWRAYFSLFDLKAMLPMALRDRIIGMTPVLDDDIPYSRYVECLRWMDENTLSQDESLADKNIDNGQWIAVDDYAPYFPPNCHQLIVTDPLRGVDAPILEQLLRALNAC